MDQRMIDDTVGKLKEAWEAIYRLRCRCYVEADTGALKFKSLLKTEQMLDALIGELARESNIKGKWVKWTLPEAPP